MAHISKSEYIPPESRPRTLKNRPAQPAAATAGPDDGRGIKYHIVVGLACGVGALAVFGFLILFQHAPVEARETVPAPALSPSTQVMQQPLEPIGQAPAPAGTAQLATAGAAIDPGPGPRTPAKPRTIPGKRALRAQVSAAPFHGTVFDPDSQPNKAPAAKTEAAEEAPEVVVANTASVDTEPPVSATDHARSESAATESGESTPGEKHTGSKIKKVFGSILRPFGHRKPAEKSAVPPQGR